MVRTLLVRGLLLGLLAGLVAGAFAFVVGEPHVESAIAIEEAASAEAASGVAANAASGAEAGAAHEHEGGTAEAARGHDHGEEAVVSRPGQKAGLFLATGLYGLSVGGVFALVYAGLRGRVGPRSEGGLALAAAATAFLAIVLVPFLKYPANPPAVGDPDTIGDRTLLYVVMVLVGLAATAVSAASTRRVSRAAGPWARWGVAAGTFLIPVIVAWLLLPRIDEVPEGFPGSLIWEFRLASLGTQLVFWASFGVLFGLACDRAARHTIPAPAGEPLSAPS
ncbi:CbtA family protein [Nonomuraea sp. NPDC046570]|uniref:CbtA family protein n=1 Tax=Nonomuraea sp. NPDC046570 TaxID=3155255 RepID=UPI0033CCBD02